MSRKAADESRRVYKSRNLNVVCFNGYQWSIDSEKSEIDVAGLVEVDVAIPARGKRPRVLVTQGKITEEWTRRKAA